MADSLRRLQNATRALVLCALLGLLFGHASHAWAARVILNEFSPVGSGKYLNGGNATVDESGGQAGDLTFGRILGNGGDWFELVVTEGVQDLRGWQLEIWIGGILNTTLILSQAPLWSQVRAGTLITVAEEQPQDTRYDPDAGDWTIHIQTDDNADGTYITALSFPVNNDDWQLVIKDAGGAVEYGPSGEGISATGGVSSTEIYRLEENPGSFITPTTLCYDDADTQSTYGQPNRWGDGRVQDFGPLRNGTAPTIQCGETEGITDLAFDLTRILEVEITMLPEDYDAMRRQNRRLLDVFGGACGETPPTSPYTWFPGDVTVDGTTVASAGIRKKGFLGSPSVTKPALKIKFDEFGSEGSIYGLERLTLNNGRQDPSLLDTCLAYDLFHAAGLVAARCSFAHVTVNGNDLGIYINVDSLKDPFLVRNFGSAAGNLYEGTTADFRANWIGVFEKKNNEDGSELNAVAETLLIEDDAQFLAAIETVIDRDKFMTYWALSGLIGDWDGYVGNSNNFWLYNNPQTDLLEWLPWSLDDVFGRANPFGGAFGSSSIAPTIFDNAALPHRLWQIESVRVEYQERINELLDTIWDEATLLATLDAREALISPIAGDLSGPADETRTWIQNRAAKVASDFANGPPDTATVLANKSCLETRGEIGVEFSTTYSDPLPAAPAYNPFTVTTFNYNGTTSMPVPYSVNIGNDPIVGDNRPVLRTVGFHLPAQSLGFVFNLALDQEDAEGPPSTPAAVNDSLFSFLFYLDASGASPQIFPLGFLADSTATFDEADLSPGGTVSGSFESSLLGWVAHPPADPDYDADGITAALDNCPFTANADQLNTDGDSQGDACDTDDDNDDLADRVETNTGVFIGPDDTGSNPLVGDTDGDGIADGIEVLAGTDPNTVTAQVPALSNGALGFVALVLAGLGFRRARRTYSSIAMP